jgi:DNA-directed RNA polymerase subunit beta
VFDGANEIEIEAELARAWLMDLAWQKTADAAWNWLNEQDYSAESIRDDSEVRLLYMEQWLGDRGHDVYAWLQIPSMPAASTWPSGCATLDITRMMY